MTQEISLKHISILIDGVDVDFLLARHIGEEIAKRENQETTLVSWQDKQRNVHSPQCLHCEIRGEPGWEVYGRNHGGRLRMSFNHDALVLIYS